MALRHETEEDRWAYNAEDCIHTREIGEASEKLIKSLGLEQVEAFQQSMFEPVLYAMVRGVRVDKRTRDRLAGEVQEELSKREEFLTSILGHSINPRSSKQMTTLFYEDLKQPAIYTRAKKGVPGHLTCDDEALQKIAAREPMLKPLINAIADIRTLGIFLNNFILAGLDEDGRMRCSYNLCGTVTFRLASGKNAFGGGCNLQTVPSDKSKSVGKAAARGSAEFKLPNLRTMLVPDPGYTFFDMDLDRADLQVVVWEADDDMLKAALRMGADIHLMNVYTLDGKEPPPLEELVETHPRYPDHRGPRKHKREFAKVFCHGTNYVGSAKTIAGHTGRSVHEVDQAQRRWFGAHPGIKRWHTRVEAQIKSKRYVENAFGYRWYIFDRVDSVLPEAVAWIPQSTVGCVINRAWRNFHSNIPRLETLLQVHDSLAGQFPTHLREVILPRMREEARIVVPYPDPLIIPVGIKTSEISWGDCK